MWCLPSGCHWPVHHPSWYSWHRRFSILAVPTRDVLHLGTPDARGALSWYSWRERCSILVFLMRERCSLLVLPTHIHTDGVPKWHHQYWEVSWTGFPAGLSKLCADPFSLGDGAVGNTEPAAEHTKLSVAVINHLHHAVQTRKPWMKHALSAGPSHSGLTQDAEYYHDRTCIISMLIVYQPSLCSLGWNDEKLY